MGKRKHNGHGPKGKSVALPVYEGVAKQLDSTIEELRWTTQRLHDTQALLVGVLIQQGDLDIDDLPPDCQFGLDAEAREGGVILRLTKEAPEGQGGENADEHGQSESTHNN